MSFDTSASTNVTHRLSHEEWVAKGTRLFGANPDNWKFRCAQCGNIQCVAEFRKLGITDPRIAQIACISRFNGNSARQHPKCDWIFDETKDYSGAQLLEVAAPCGIRRCFQFAEGERTEAFL